MISLNFATQPTSLEVNPNSNISFTASAVGTGPITYIWYKNSSIYPGISDVIFINNVTKITYALENVFDFQNKK